MQITKLVLDNFSSYEGKTVFDFTVKKKDGLADLPVLFYYQFMISRIPEIKTFAAFSWADSKG